MSKALALTSESDLASCFSNGHAKINFAKMSQDIGETWVCWQTLHQDSLRQA